MGEKPLQNWILFDRDRLGKVPRLINIAAVAVSDVIGEKLQRNNLQRGGEEGVGFRKKYNLVGFVQKLPLIFGGKRHNGRAARLDLLDIAHQLVKKGRVVGQRNNQPPLVNQGDGAVLKFPCGVGLRMNIRNLLQLE